MVGLGFGLKVVYDNYDVDMITIVWSGYQNVGLSSDLQFCI